MQDCFKYTDLLQFSWYVSGIWCPRKNKKNDVSDGIPSKTDQDFKIMWSTSDWGRNENNK